MSDAAFVVGDTPGERLHPLFLLTGLGKVIRGAWGIAVGGAFFAFNDRPGTAILLVGGFIVLSIVSLLIKWLTFEFRLGADELHIDQGLLSRSSRAIPFDRVTDVDIEQGPIHRLLGLARVRMETGASAASKDEEGVLDTVTLERAEAIRDFVRARRRGPVPEAQSAERGETSTSPLFAMDLRRVLIAGLFNFSLAMIAVLFGATQTFGDLIGFDPFERRFWSELFANAGPLRDFVLAHQIVAGIGGTLTLLLIGFGTGIVRTLLRDYRFRLDRTDSGFRRRRGLLTLTDVTIPTRRVQASILSTGPARRALGWFSLRFQSLAMDDKQGDHVVAPLARVGEAELIQQAIGRPLAPAADSWRRLPFAFVTSAALPLLGVAIVGAAIGTLVHPALLLTALGFSLAAAARWAEWRHARYALDEDHLFIEQGFWRQRRSILPVARIQSLDLTESFWTRLFGFSRMRLGVAGGSVLAPFSIAALDRDEAQRLRERLLQQ